MRILKAIPLFAVMLALYNALVVGVGLSVDHGLFGARLASGALWEFSVGDALLCTGVLLLYVELFKATRTGIASVVDHTLSVITFIAFLLEFLLVAAAGTSLFFLLGLMALVDVVAGFTVTIVAARRDFAVGDHLAS